MQAYSCLRQQIHFITANQTIRMLSRFQVETVGDAYMVVSGVPERIKNHGERVADMALAMLSDVTSITAPNNSNDHLKIRIGNVHLKFLFH